MYDPVDQRKVLNRLGSAVMTQWVLSTILCQKGSAQKHDVQGMTAENLGKKKGVSRNRSSRLSAVMPISISLAFRPESTMQFLLQGYATPAQTSLESLENLPTYLPVSIMHICTGCLTGENPPNSAVMSCHLYLFYCPAKSQVTEIPLDDFYPLCPRSSTPSPPMGWFP